MQTIKNHIKQNEYSSIYLLFGQETYLKRLYRDKLKKAILGNGSDMNYHYFEGSNVVVDRIIEDAETLPFFSDRRLIVIENSGLFKSANSFADYIKNLPPTTYLVFVEKEVDRRNRLYKAVKDKGTISQMDGMDDRNLKYWIATMFEKANKKITEATILYLMDKVGKDMENLSQEVEKVICYALNREVICKEDIQAICTTQVTGQIFQMIDAVASGKQTQALQLYYDLLAVREKPMSILYLMIRHFNILLQMSELPQATVPNASVAEKIGIGPSFVNKYRAQGKRFQRKMLIDILTDCANMEELFKTGRMNEQMVVELLIVRYSTKLLSN